MRKVCGNVYIILVIIIFIGLYKGICIFLNKLNIFFVISFWLLNKYVSVILCIIVGVNNGNNVIYWNMCFLKIFVWVIVYV